MDFLKVIDFLHQYPSWYRLLVVLWLIVSAVLAGGLLVFRPESHPPPASGVVASSASGQPAMVSLPVPTVSSASLPAVSSAPLSDPVGEAATAHSYFSKLGTLAERFLEKQEFIERTSGRTVEWEGLVEGVSQRDSYISLHFIVEGISPERTVYVLLPESLRTKAFSLQKGDLVRVKGKLSLSTPRMPDLDAIELTLVRPRSAS